MAERLCPFFLPEHHPMKAIDIEVYPNFFLCIVMDIRTRRWRSFRMCHGEQLDREELAKELRGLTVGFNSWNYDIPILCAALDEKASLNCGDIFQLSSEIIEKDDPRWMTIRDYGLVYPDGLNHIDLIEPAPGVLIGPKLYGARIHSRVLRDLPYPPDQSLSESQADQVEDYCINDCNVTCDIYVAIHDRLELRQKLSVRYNTDLRSKSDAQIAEAVISKALNGHVRRPGPLREGTEIFYTAPDWVSFITDDLRRMKSHVEGKTYVIGKDGHFSKLICKLPSIKIGAMRYQMGIGGLHSTEKRRLLRSEWGRRVLIDCDVSSYYPSLILRLGINPEGVGERFQGIYREIVETRLEAKSRGDEVTADGLKITTNGTFGKLSSPYSFLYSPKNMLRVTLSGQLALLMLIERLELAGIMVVSANTDGVLCHLSNTVHPVWERICNQWQEDTGLTLESHLFNLVASRDVNNYFAIGFDGKVKMKGIFEPAGLKKNPDGDIVHEAVIEYLKCGTPIRKTIVECDDIRKFLFVRQSRKSQIEHNGEPIGRVGRWYCSKNGTGLKNHIGKIAKSDGGHPVKILGRLPSDVDYERYVSMAGTTLYEIGVCEDL